MITVFSTTNQTNKLKAVKNLSRGGEKLRIKMKESEGEESLSIIPGKILLKKNEIQEKEKILKELSEKWKKERIEKENFEKKTFGFSKNSEILNGRVAMFFFATGILTEIWTKESIPGQIEIMIRTFGII